MTPIILAALMHWLVLVVLVAAFCAVIMGALLVGMWLGTRRERRARAATTKHQAAIVGGGGKSSNAVMPLVRRASRVQTGKPPKVWRKIH